ncbi:unnamed protein product [Camellia sinensis]
MDLWVEAELLAKIQDIDVKNFIWKNIITRFGIPRAIIVDNGTQFDNKLIKSFCAKNKIKNYYSTPSFPQSNGQAEASNKTILDGIKKRLEAANEKWVEELPNVLWEYQTMPRRSTGESPFSMAYGIEAVIPLEVGNSGIRTHRVKNETNEAFLARDLDLLEERRERAAIRLGAYQQHLARVYNKKVNPKEFQVGDFVLRNVVGNKKDPREGKLGPNWEGPYRIISVTGNGAYRLKDSDGKELPRPWNICNLKFFYH